MQIPAPVAIAHALAEPPPGGVAIARASTLRPLGAPRPPSLWLLDTPQPLPRSVLPRCAPCHPVLSRPPRLRPAAPSAPAAPAEPWRDRAAPCPQPKLRPVVLIAIPSASACVTRLPHLPADLSTPMTTRAACVFTVGVGGKSQLCGSRTLQLDLCSRARQMHLLQACWTVRTATSGKCAVRVLASWQQPRMDCVVPELRTRHTAAACSHCCCAPVASRHRLRHHSQAIHEAGLCMIA